MGVCAKTPCEFWHKIDGILYMVKNDYKDRSDRRRGRGDYKRAELLTGKALPAAKAAEARLLAAAMLDAEVVHRAYKAGVREVSFSESKAGLLWSVIERLWKAQRSTDAAVVVEEMKRTQQLEVLGDGDARAGLGYVLKVSQEVPTTAQAAEYIERVVETAELRELIALSASVQEKCYDYAGGGVAEAVGAEVDALMAKRVKAQRELPPIMSGAEFAAMKPVPPPWLIKNVLRVGEVDLFTAESKGTKSWGAIMLSIALGQGLPWLGFETVKSDVLHIDIELEPWALRERAEMICKARGCALPENVDWWGLRGYAKSIDDLVPHILARAPRGRYQRIVIEPSYTLLGKRDENDNGDVTDFFMVLFMLARVTGASIGVTHHHRKGDVSKSSAKDRMSGAGAWSRAPDVLLNLSALSEEQGEDTYALEFTTRHVKKPPTLGVKWAFPIMVLQSGLDVNALRESGAPKTSTSEDVVGLLPEPPDGLSFTQWQAVAKRKIRGRDGEPISDRTFARRVKEAAGADQVVQVGSLYLRAK